MKRFTKGGIVPGGYQPPKLERGWWKCNRCGATFESWNNPPIDHRCAKSAEEILSDVHRAEAKLGLPWGTKR